LRGDSGGCAFLIHHSEASYSEAVRISPDATGVILSGAFPREDLFNPIRHCETSFFEVVAISRAQSFLFLSLWTKGEGSGFDWFSKNSNPPNPLY
jgi:hypothetical protein